MTPTHASDPPDPDWRTLTKALEDIRDSWVLISFCLTDILAEEPSSLRDETAAKTEQYLHGFRTENRDRNARI